MNKYRISALSLLTLAMISCGQNIPSVNVNTTDPAQIPLVLPEAKDRIVVQRSTTDSIQLKWSLTKNIKVDLVKKTSSGDEIIAKNLNARDQYTDKNLSAQTAYTYQLRDVNGKVIDERAIGTVALGQQAFVDSVNESNSGFSMQAVNDNAELLSYFINTIPDWDVFSPANNNPATPDQVTTIFTSAKGNKFSTFQSLASSADVNKSVFCQGFLFFGYCSVPIMINITGDYFKSTRVINTDFMNLGSYDPFNNPNEGLWVGGLYQGKRLKQGLPGFQELPISQRGPIQITTTLPITGNAVTLPAATVTAVNNEISNFITRAQKEVTPSKLSTDFVFSYKYSRDVNNLATQLGLDVSILPVSFTASLGSSMDATKTNIVASFRQSAFSINTYEPQTPNQFFSDQFTKTLLDQQIALGRMGKDNPPMFLSGITYGRALIFNFSSTEDKQTLGEALQLMFNTDKKAFKCDEILKNPPATPVTVTPNPGMKSLNSTQAAAPTPPPVSIGVEACQKIINTLSKTQIYVAGVGFEAGVVAQGLKEGMSIWNFVSGEAPAVTSYVPIKYVFKSVREGKFTTVVRRYDKNYLECARKNLNFVQQNLGVKPIKLNEVVFPTNLAESPDYTKHISTCTPEEISTYGL